MDVVISGSSGLIGTALQEELSRQGHTPIPLVRDTPGPGELAWSPRDGEIDSAGIEKADAVVHLAAAGIGDKRWSDDRKRVILESRTQGTSLLASALADMANGPKTFISASAIGYYGDRGDEWLTEDSGPGEGFVANVVVEWERASRPASDGGVRTVNIRTGIVEAKEDGALNRLLLPFKLGLGGPVPPGDQYMSWISLTDEVRAIVHLLTADVEGPVNLVAPNPVTNAEHAKTLGKVLNRPAVIPTPIFVPKLLYGSELIEHLLLGSQRVSSQKLQESGFEFDHPTLEAAFRSELD